MRIAETEIDLLCIGQAQYLVGECKFKERPFSYAEYLDTLAKLTPQKETAEFYYALFSESGFEPRVIAAAAENRTQLYTLEQIVSPA